MTARVNKNTHCSVTGDTTTRVLFAHKSNLRYGPVIDASGRMMSRASTRSQEGVVRGDVAQGLVWVSEHETDVTRGAG